MWTRIWKTWGSRSSEKTTHTQTAFATIGSIVILERTDDFVVLVGERERTGEGGSRWHGLHVSLVRSQSGGMWAEGDTARSAPQPGARTPMTAAARRSVESNRTINWKILGQARMGRGEYLETSV